MPGYCKFLWYRTYQVVLASHSGGEARELLVLEAYEGLVESQTAHGARKGVGGVGSSR